MPLPAVKETINSVLDKAPEVVRERPEASIGLSAFLTAYSLTWTVQRAAKKYMPGPLYRGLNKFVAIAAWSTPFVYAAADPAGMQDLMQQDPEIFAGLLGADAGIGIRAAQGSREKPKEQDPEGPYMDFDKGKIMY